MKEPYSSKLVEALATLESTRTKLFDLVINVGMHGVYADINEVLEEGDSYDFTLDHFDNTNDESVQTLVNLVKYVDYTSRKLMKINEISPEQVDV